ncbi:hypothetical protein [Paenibacillus sp. IHBB 10380]|nr:hypothetical protein [Paenibacillus sp. IHBB 10380]
MMRRRIEDERITSLVHRYGYQAFGLLFVLLMISALLLLQHSF